MPKIRAMPLKFLQRNIRCRITFNVDDAVAPSRASLDQRAELPGLDQSNIAIAVSNGILTIKDEKQEE